MMKKQFYIFVFLFAFANVISAQTISVEINNLGSINPGTQTIQVTYEANGDFQASDGTDDWGGQVLTLGWTPGSGMTETQPMTNDDITNFTSDFLPFIGAFSGGTGLITFSLGDVGGTDDGNIYFSVVVNTSTLDKPMSNGTIEEVFRFDVPDSWTGPDNSVFLLETQPAGALVQLAPKIDNNGVGGNVWDGGSAGAPLPIELSFFDVSRNGKNAVLQWESILEINASHYGIERSTNLIEWKELGKVQTKGDGAGRFNYSFTDYDIGLSESRCYYRLKLVDRDGAYKYSEIRQVVFEPSLSDGLEVNLFPNPCTDFLRVESSEDLINSVLYMFNSNGQLVSTYSLDNTFYEIQLNDFTPGSYSVAIKKGNDQIWSETIIILK